jgi:hypothetical protein
MMTCRICSGPYREAIDKALMAGTPFRHIASQYGTSTGALQRHKRDHLPQALVKAQEVKDIAHARSLLGQLADLTAEAKGILDGAREGGDYRAMLAAVRELREIIAVTAKLTGEFDKHSDPAIHKHLHLHGSADELRQLAEKLGETSANEKLVVANQLM